MHTSIKLVNFDSTSIGNDKMNSDYSPKFNKGNKVFKGTMIRRPITEDPNKPFVVLGKNSKSGHFYLDRTKKRNSRYDCPNEASEVPASFKDNHQLNIAYSPKSIEFKQITKTEKVLPSRPNSTKPRPTLAKQWKSKAAKVDPSKSKSNIFIYNAEYDKVLID